MTMAPYNPDITRALKWLQNNAPNIQSIVTQKADWYGKYNDQFWMNWEENVFDLRTANAFGLVVWCIILGLPLSAFNFQPITNAFAFGSQRGNFQDGGGHVAPFTFVGTPTIYSNGIALSTSSYAINSATAQITFGGAPAIGAKLTWSGSIQNPNTSQTLVVQQPRPIGTGDGITTVFNMFPADGGNYDEVGSNFYGGGSSSVASLNEIRYACMLRYVTLVSNGRIQWINQMLAYIFNGGAAWTPTTKKYFYLADSTLANLGVTGASIYRQDWQGNQLMYATPRTNLVKYSQDFTNAAWLKQNAGVGVAPVVTGNYATAPDGTMTASRVQFNLGGGVAGSDYSRLTQNVTTIAQQGYASGVWVRSTDGVSTYTLQLTFNGQYTGNARITVGPTWTFVTQSIASAIDTSRNFRFDTQGGAGTSNTADILMWGAMHVQGAVTGAYIPTTSAAVTVTDYSINTTTANVTFSTAPVTGAVLTYSGTYQGVTTPTPQQFGTGNGSMTSFMLSLPPGAPAPISTPYYMEYRIGANMGLSAQFVNLLNNASYGIMPTCAGIRYAVVQES
jgi:hypothetical protein